ncbi:zf-HC2 domain-containing protein [Streptomyces sp. NPDC048330]|uniref:zf-HC2 domain-containing protein n=1 Tax=Streptomyces sp. NPDC048330 TaxID=3365533 RepID=UPI0037114651
MKQHATDAHTLSAAYALGALDPGERAGFEHHLRVCETCRQEAAEFGTTAALLGATVSEAAPMWSKARVMAAVKAVRQLPPLPPPLPWS